MKPRANIYFSGAGLMDLGLKRGGIEVQQSFEIEEQACAVARANGHDSIRQDLTQKLVSEELPCDVSVATYPCNKYTEIAAIHGTRTGDNLYLHYFRHLALRPPEVYVLENVPGMKKFPVVMEAMTRLPGYYVNVFCPIQSHLWLPQKRDRMIIFGSRKNFNWRPPQSTHRIRLAEILEDEPSLEIPPYFYKRFRGGYRDRPIICDPANDDIAPTCVAHYSKDRSTRVVKDKRFKHGVRPFTVREYARLQGVPDSFMFNCSDSLAYKFIGNGVSIPVGEWIGRELRRYFNQRS